MVAGPPSAPPVAGPRSSGLATPFALGIVAVTALALWMVWPAFEPGRIVNLDAPRHLLRLFVMTTQFLPSGQVDGWSPWWYLGAQLFLFQSYGYFFVMGLTALVLRELGHLATIEQVFKFYYVLPIVLLPASAALMARRLGVSPRGALAAALASLIFSASLGYGMMGMFGIGLLLQGVGVIGFALAWPEILKVLLERGHSPWRAALAIAAVLLCHFISGAYMLAAAGCVAAGLALATRTLRPLLRYGLIAAFALLLAGHSLFPSLEMHDLAGSGVGWGSDRDRFWRVLQGTLFGAQRLAIPAILAAVWAIVDGMRGGNRALAISAMVFFGTALAGGANEQAWMPPKIESVIQALLRPRALPYAALLQAVFAGVAIDHLLRGIEAIARRYGRVSRAGLATPLVLVATVVFFWPDLQSQRRFVRTESELKPGDRRVYVKLVEWLRANVDPPSIVAVPRTLLPQTAIGARSVISLLNLDTGLYTLNGDQAELTKSARRAGRVDLDRIDVNPERSAAVLRASGVSHLIVSREDVRKELVGNTDFIPVFEFEKRARWPGFERRKKLQKTPRNARRQERDRRPPLGVAVYRVRGGGEWIQGPTMKFERTHYSPEKISWKVDIHTERPSRPATAAINWHPNWTATVDGALAPTRCSPARRVQFDVPAGAKQVTLEFRRTTREKLWGALSLGTFFFVIAAWWRGTRTP